jgi:hypothetical protein
VDFLGVLHTAGGRGVLLGVVNFCSKNLFCAAHISIGKNRHVHVWKPVFVRLVAKENS